MAEPLTAYFREALDTLADRVEEATETRHSTDFRAIARRFRALYHSGERADPEAVAAHLVQEQAWDPELARKVAFVWEIVDAVFAVDEE